MPMTLSSTRIPLIKAAIIATLTLVASLSLSAKSSKEVNIKNFGKVNQNYFRGGQPEAAGFEDLRRIGVRTVIDLQDGDRRKEESTVKALGLNYINIPLDDHDRPYDEQVQKFLSLAQDQNNWPIFVHCAGGRHRTGALTAAYRMTVDGWNMEQAYREMKDYGFYSSWGHGGYKDYVYDYQNHSRVASVGGIGSGAGAAQK